MNKIKILLVEDDPNLGEVLKEYLNLKGYETTLSRNGEDGWDDFRKEQYDLCILDIMMPKKDGFTLAQEIRQLNEQVPIIFLTAKSMKEDTLRGLRIGADDYITKPFSMEELLLRMKAIMRRTQGPSDDKDEIGGCHIGKYYFDFRTSELRSPQKNAKLTTKEAALLKLFCNNRNKILLRSFALKMVWGDDSYFNARSMDVYIARLRKYLKDDDSIKIVTIHGEGFKLLAPSA